MNTIESKIRTIIRQVLSENFQELEEARKSGHFDMYMQIAFEKTSLDIPEGKFEVPNTYIINQVHSLLDTKLSHVFRKDFDMIDFYIVKLGRFATKKDGVKEVLPFKKEGIEDIRYSYMYLYVYKNQVELIRFGSEFFETDDILLREAQKYIINHKINLISLTEKGKVIIDHRFGNDNVIDLTEYNKIQKPEVNTKRFGVAYIPKKYKAGDSFMHRDFGKGKVLATKRVKADIPTIDVTVRFPKGEGTVDKTIRMQQKNQSQTQ